MRTVAEWTISIRHSEGLSDEEIDKVINALDSGHADDKVRFIGEQITELVRSVVPDAELVVEP